MACACLLVVTRVLWRPSLHSESSRDLRQAEAHVAQCLRPVATRSQSTARTSLKKESMQNPTASRKLLCDTFDISARPS